jgi:hypothetical protein
MQRSLPAIALCALVHAAMAGPAAAAPTHPAPPQQQLTSAALVAQAPATPAPARTQGETVAMQATLPSPASASHKPADEPEHRPTGIAMLLAAVALMTGIALRRWGARDQ